MKVLLILSGLIVCSLAASVPFQRAVAFKELLVSEHAKQARIVNGQPATPNLIPHQVAVMSPVTGGLTVCGGSLLSLVWILCAAQCTIVHAQFNLRFGSINLQTGGITHTSFSAINHPMYNPANLNNDISLIQNPVTLTQTPAIVPVRLSTLAQSTATFVGNQARVSGWGYTHLATGASDVLNFVHMNAVTNFACEAIFGSVVIQPFVICALGWEAPNQGHCAGDAGGPLTIFEDGGIATQIGVVSFGSAAGCQAAHPHGFMRTSHYAQWIQNMTGIQARP